MAERNAAAPGGAPAGRSTALPAAWDQRLARLLVRPLARTPVTPNHVTTFRLLLGLAACGLFATGMRPEILYAAGLFMASNFVDHMDGELARLSGKSSRFGHHYDNACDAFIHVALFVSIGFGLRESWIGGWAPFLGLVAGISVSALFLMFGRIERRAGARQARQPQYKGFHLEDVMYFIGPITWCGGLIVLLLAGVGLTPLYAAWLAWRERVLLFGGRPEESS